MCVSYKREVENLTVKKIETHYLLNIENENMDGVANFYFRHLVTVLPGKLTRLQASGIRQLSLVTWL